MAPKSEDLYPSMLFVGSSDRQGRFFSAHKTPEDVALFNQMKPTRVWVYKRERLVVISGLARVEEQGDAKE